MNNEQFDITYEDFNPTILFACKGKVTQTGDYHKHDFTEIIYILSGHSKYIINNEIYDLYSGDMFICNPGIYHQLLFINNNEPCVEFYCGFTDFQFKNMSPNCIDINDKYILHMSCEAKQEILKLCYNMVVENLSCKAGKYFMLKAYLIQMLLTIIREFEIYDCKPETKGCNFDNFNKNYAVKKIITYINENYSHKISLDKIAQNMYLSPVYISKIFKEETGESPINYLIKIRLEKAKEILLQSNSNSIKEVATLVGYEDAYYFSKLFKKYYGVSPLNYKKRTLCK